MKDAIIKKVIEFLSGEGYKATDCSRMRSAFDIIAKKDKLLVLKVVENIEGITPSCTQDLATIANYLDAVPLVIGEKIRDSKMSSGVVYTRYEIPTMNLATLRQLVQKEGTDAYSTRGNYCINIDGEKLKGLRKSMNMSLFDLSKAINVSKQTVYRCERFGKTSLDIANRLIEFFDEDITVPKKLEVTITSKTAENVTDDFHKDILNCFVTFGIKPILTHAPFDILAKDEKYIFTIVNNDVRVIKRKACAISNIREVVNGYGVCISRSKDVSESVFVISPHELCGISRKDFFSMLKEFENR